MDVLEALLGLETMSPGCERMPLAAQMAVNGSMTPRGELYEKDTDAYVQQYKIPKDLILESEHRCCNYPTATNARCAVRIGLEDRTRHP